MCALLLLFELGGGGGGDVVVMCDAGIGLDGRGLYGQFEGVNNQMPVLDACGGHWGPTPASTFTDKAGHTITVSAQTNGYHYHIIAGGIVCCSSLRVVDI